MAGTAFAFSVEHGNITAQRKKIPFNQWLGRLTEMNKRLRKKKRLGEFREYGFPVGFCLSSELSLHARNALLDDWIANAIEANGLQFGGGGCENVWSGYVANDARGSVTPSQRGSVESWLRQHPSVLEYELGPAIDMWHGNFDYDWQPTAQQRADADNRARG